MENKMILKDGKPFVIGDKIFDSNGDLIDTSIDCTIEVLQYQGKDYYFLKNGLLSSGIGNFYSSQESRIKDHISVLEKLKKEINNEIKDLEEGEKSHSLPILFSLIRTPRY